MSTQMSFVNQSPKEILDMIQSACPAKIEEICEALPLPGTKKEGYSAVYRNKKSYNGLLSVPHPSIRTVKDIFDLTTSVNPKSPCLGYRKKDANGNVLPYLWDTYQEVQQKALDFGAGVFFVLGNNPFITDSECHRKISEHSTLAERNEMSFILTLYSHNTREWCIADLACASYSITNTALYDTLGTESTEHILTLTETPIVLCTKDKANGLINLKKNNPALVNFISIVVIEPLTEEDEPMVTFARKNNIVVHSFDQVAELGNLSPKAVLPPNPETVYTISFTSGTTLAPKGVVLTHKNAVASTVFVLSGHIGTKFSRYYCFLPLAHIYSRMSISSAYLMSSSIGLPQSPSPLTLLDDVKELKPHSLALVPRVLLRFESAIKAATINNTEKPFLAKLFKLSIDKKINLMLQHNGAEGRLFLADILIGQLRKKLGMQNLVALGSGSAPLSPESIKFLKASLNVGLGQGYGLTESFAGVCGSLFYEADPGSCGPIAVTCEAKLRDLPEMNYYSTSPDGPAGELMIRGPQIFREYFKNPTETAKVKDKDGWFRTGDVARFDPKDGRIFIIDRIKNFFKLSQGEYVTPEKIENIYMSLFPLLAQIFIHGDSYSSYLVGIVGVDEVGIKPWIKARFDKEVTSIDEITTIMNQKDVKKLFLEEMNFSTKGALQGFERLHNIMIDIEPFKAEDGALTPTMKIKRERTFQIFETNIKGLYSEGSLIRNTESKL